MIRCRAPPLLPMRMLSSSSSSPSFSINPNPRLNPAVKAKPYSRIPKPSRLPSPISNPVNLPQSMTLSSGSFCGPTNPIAVPSSAGTRNPDFELDGSDSDALVVVSFYKFADFPDHAHMRQPLKQLCEELVLFFFKKKILFVYL